MKKIWIISNNYVLDDVFPEENGAIAYMMRAYNIKKDDLTVENDSTFVSGTSPDGEFIMASQWEIGEQYQKFVIVSQIWKDGDNLKTSMFVNGFSQYSDLQMIKHLLGIEQARFKRAGPAQFCDSIYHYDGKSHSITVRTLVEQSQYLSRTYSDGLPTVGLQGRVTCSPRSDEHCPSDDAFLRYKLLEQCLCIH